LYKQCPHAQYSGYTGLRFSRFYVMRLLSYSFRLFSVILWQIA